MKSTKEKVKSRDYCKNSTKTSTWSWVNSKLLNHCITNYSKSGRMKYIWRNINKPKNKSSKIWKRLKMKLKLWQSLWNMHRKQLINHHITTTINNKPSIRWCNILAMHSWKRTSWPLLMKELNNLSYLSTYSINLSYSSSRAMILRSSTRGRSSSWRKLKMRSQHFETKKNKKKRRGWQRRRYWKDNNKIGFYWLWKIENSNRSPE